jgi:hypothetical protein
MSGDQVAAHELRNGFFLLAHAAGRVEAVADQWEIKAAVALVMCLQAVLTVVVQTLDNRALNQVRPASFVHHGPFLADVSQQEPAICNVTD